MQVWFFLNFRTICKNIQLKIGTEDIQFLYHDIMKAKNNNSAVVSVIAILLEFQNFAKYALPSTILNLIFSTFHGFKTCISALKRPTNYPDKTEG